MIGYTTPAEVERLREGKTAVVQGERSDACTVAVFLAGAGPAGEAVTRADLLAWAKEFVEREGDGETDCVTPFDAHLYARSVEGPGEVERLTRERDAAMKAATHWQDRYRDAATAFDRPDLGQRLTVHRRIAAEAALAETRERLEKERDRGFNHGYLMAVANIINLYRETVVAADVLLQIDLTIEDAEAFELAEYDMEALNRLRAEPRAADFFKRQRRAALTGGT